MMFGFRGGNAKRNKVHSSTKQRGTKPQNNNALKRLEQPKLDPFPPQPQEQQYPMVEERFMDDNNSLDMSLYTTQSKATVLYPSRRVVDHSYESDSDDGISRAPTEFTTEVALNRYARLGGSWMPPSPLHGPTTPSPASSAVTPPYGGEDEEKPLTPTTDPLSKSPNPSDNDDDESLDASSASEDDDDDCETRTIYSLLPATAKMARLMAFRGAPQSTAKSLLIRNSSSMEANGSADGVEEEPQPIKKKNQAISPPLQRTGQHYYNSTGPVDLDASVPDSSSRASSSKSWDLSPPPANKTFRSLDEQVEQTYGLPSDARSRRSANDDDTYGYSAAAGGGTSTTSGMKSRTTTNSVQSPPQQQHPVRIEAQGVSPELASVASVSAQSWVQRQNLLGFDDASTILSARDDDTYGFSVASPPPAQKSVVTSTDEEASGDVAPRDQVRRVELFRQWDEDSYNITNTSILSKSRAISSPLHQFYDEDSTTLLSAASPAAKSLASTSSRGTSPQKSIVPVAITSQKTDTTTASVSGRSGVLASANNSRKTEPSVSGRSGVSANVNNSRKTEPSVSGRSGVAASVDNSRKSAPSIDGLSGISSIHSHSPEDKRSPSSLEKISPSYVRSVASGQADDDSLEQLIATSLSRPKAVRRLQHEMWGTSSSVSQTSSVAKSAKKLFKSPPAKTIIKAPSPPASITAPSTPSKLVDRSVMSDLSSNFPRPPSQTNLARMPDSQVQKLQVRDVSSPIQSPLSTKQGPPSRRDQEVVQRPGLNSLHSARIASSLVIDRDTCGLTVVSALTPAPGVEPMDDDTYGFSTASHAHIPSLPDDATCGFGSLAEPIIGDDDDRDYVWTDQQGDLEDERNNAVLRQQVARELLNQTYQQTLDTYSVARRSHDSGILSPAQDDEDDDHYTIVNTSSGAVLLTEAELQKHLKIVEKVQPFPSSEIEGYDAWKRQKERQQRYFVKLQEKAAKKQKDRRQPVQGQRSSPSIDHRQHTVQPFVQQAKYSFDEDNRCMDSTRSAMDKSMDSSIPTLDDGKWKPRKKNRRGVGWGWFQGGKKGTTKSKKTSSVSSPSDKKSKSTKKHSHQQTTIVTLSQFMRISADEPPEVAEYSMSPLHKDGVLTLGTTTLPDFANTVAGTYSHNLESVGEGPRRMAVHFLEEEREKQRRAERDKKEDHDPERERIERLRREAVEKQRRLNLYNEKPPRQERNSSAVDTDSTVGSGSNRITTTRSKGSRKVKSREDDSIVDKSISVSSKRSVDSSIKSGSGKLLSPCIVCNDAERTHIAMPCMHFYFCSKCVERLYESEQPVCPVCSTTNVAFSRVYTG